MDAVGRPMFSYISKDTVQPWEKNGDLRRLNPMAFHRCMAHIPAWMRVRRPGCVTLALPAEYTLFHPISGKLVLVKLAVYFKSVSFSAAPATSPCLGGLSLFGAT